MKKLISVFYRYRPIRKFIGHFKVIKRLQNSFWGYAGYSGVCNSSGARTLIFGKFATKYKLITVNTTINFYISAIQHNY